MRFQVPQFVDIEDKIVGPLTLKQFFIYLGGVFLLLPVWAAADLSLFVTLAIPILGVAALFAHFKLNGKSLFAVLRNGVNFYTRGQLFIWQRTGKEKVLRLEGGHSGTIWAVYQANSSPLTKMAQALETQGRILQSDLEDPLVGEEAPTPLRS